MASLYWKIKQDGKWVMMPCTHCSIDGYYIKKMCECDKCLRRMYTYQPREEE